jgi:hypothetical protein
MKIIKNIGNCYLCDINLEKKPMLDHLLKCHQADDMTETQECCLLKIEASYMKDYWLFIDLPMNKTLREVDTFLRKIWLECCGHLSSFHDPVDLIHTHIPKNSKLKSFDKGEVITHLYDYGTTSHTSVTFMGSISREKQRNTVRLLARNAPLVFNCEDCGKLADDTYFFFYDGTSKLLCTSCGSEYESDTYSTLPIINSPRMGMCGYTGEFDIYGFNFDSKIKAKAKT